MIAPVRRTSPDTDDCRQVARAREFIRECCRQATRYNTAYSTYLLKHVCEKWIGGYVSHDAFVTAALEEGYIFKQFNNNTPGFLKIKVKQEAFDLYRPGRWIGYGGWV